MCSFSDYACLSTFLYIVDVHHQLRIFSHIWDSLSTWKKKKKRLWKGPHGSHLFAPYCSVLSKKPWCSVLSKRPCLQDYKNRWQQEIQRNFFWSPWKSSFCILLSVLSKRPWLQDYKNRSQWEIQRNFFSLSQSEGLRLRECQTSGSHFRRVSAQKTLLIHKYTWTYLKMYVMRDEQDVSE